MEGVTRSRRDQLLEPIMHGGPSIRSTLPQDAVASREPMSIRVHGEDRPPEGVEQNASRTFSVQAWQPYENPLCFVRRHASKVIERKAAEPLLDCLEECPEESRPRYL